MAGLTHAEISSPLLVTLPSWLIFAKHSQAKCQCTNYFNRHTVSSSPPPDTHYHRNRLCLTCLVMDIKYQQRNGWENQLFPIAEHKITANGVTLHNHPYKKLGGGGCAHQFGNLLHNFLKLLIYLLYAVFQEG